LQILWISSTFLVSSLLQSKADRHDRKKIIMLSDALVAGPPHIYCFIAFRLRDSELWEVIAAMAVRSFGQAYSSCRRRISPQLVPQEHLMARQQHQLVRSKRDDVISPALGGLLISLSL
jgi:hypothetical protein